MELTEDAFFFYDHAGLTDIEGLAMKYFMGDRFPQSNRVPGIQH